MTPAAFRALPTPADENLELAYNATVFFLDYKSKAIGVALAITDREGKLAYRQPLDQMLFDGVGSDRISVITGCNAFVEVMAQKATINEAFQKYAS